MLRELSLEAHRLVRAIDASAAKDGPGADRELTSELQRDLAFVHGEVVELQRNLRAQNLHHLASYVASLRQNVEEYLT
jgi:hypothetical protein